MADIDKEENKTDIMQDIEDLKSVSKDLSELLTNSVNMVDKYYEIFFDQNPHYVELEQYNTDGTLITTLVPNRALDRSVALAGTEDPEDIVEGGLGFLYVNSGTRELFIKKTESGKKGWVNITPKKIDIFRETFAVDSNTTSQMLSYEPHSKETIDVFVNGKLLNQADFDLSIDGRTLEFYTQFPDYSTMEVKYLTGLYGLKGDTALTLKVGKTRTVNSDSPAKVTNVGSDSDIILNFDIPKGKTGDSGVWVGKEEPVENDEYLEDKNVWIDTSATGYTLNELSVTRIFDSGINTNPTAYAKAYDIMHSSIDSTKYATIGDVNVDRKGHLTVYEQGAGVRTTVKVQQLLNNNWSISGRDYIDTDLGPYQYFFTIGELDSRANTFFFRSENKSFCYLDKKDGISTALFENNATELYDKYGKGWYNWKVEYKDGVYNFYVSFANLPLTLIKRIEYSPVKQPAGSYVYISTDNVRNRSYMISDLSKFILKINGKLVWTANKTGYEHVISEDYTIVGNPTITEEGILTNVADGSHFIYGDYEAKSLLDKSWAIEGQFINIGTNSVLWQFANPNSIEAMPVEDYVYAGDYKMMGMSIEDDKVNFFLRTGTAINHSAQKTYSFDVEENVSYFYRYEYDSAKTTYKFTISKDQLFQNSDEMQVAEYVATNVNRNPFVVNVHPDYKIVLGSGSKIATVATPVNNNLNFFNIKVRDKVVWRPVFRIPVVISKYGVKFAYNDCRALVENAYQDYGVGNIFVIDEDSNTITLPLNDVYSLIEKGEINQPSYGKGLTYNADKNIVENLVEGLEIGDIGESVFVDEEIGTRRKLNGQAVTITKDLEPFFEFVKKLESKGLVVSESAWSAEAAQGDCNKFAINAENFTITKEYKCFIPQNFIIRTPIYKDDDSETTVEERHCKTCGAVLQRDQVICTECYTVNETDLGVDNRHLQDSNISHDSILGSQEGTGNEDRDDISGDTADIVGYKISISSELQEKDIVYTTSLNVLDKDTVFRRVNSIVYPDLKVTVAELVDENQYYRYEKGDFELEFESTSPNYVRLPKITNPKDGYDYYIQVATGVKNDVNLVNDYKSVSPFTYGMYQFTDVNLNAPGWLLSLGQWQSGHLYPSFYKWIKDNAEKALNNKVWNQPIMRANNVLGKHGDYYYVNASHDNGNAYIPFNGSMKEENAWWSNHGVTSADKPCWIAFHSNIPILFSKVTHTNETATPASFKTGLIQVSKDNTTWKTVREITNANNDAGAVSEFDLDWANTVDTFTHEEIINGFKHIRLYFTESFSTGGVSMQLLHFDGTLASTNKCKKWNNPNYTITNYDFVINEEDFTFRLPLTVTAPQFTQQRYLVEKKEPTESNKYWYELYSDGWLVQGDYLRPESKEEERHVVYPIPYNMVPYLEMTRMRTARNSVATNTDFHGMWNVSRTGFNTWSKWNGFELGYRAEGYVNPPVLADNIGCNTNLYFYVGDMAKNPEIINTGKCLEELSKITATALLTAPSEYFIDLGNPAKNEILVMPENGWLYMRKTATAANQYIGMYEDSTELGELHYIPISGNWAQICMPVRKGMKIRMFYTAGTHNFLRLCPMQKGGLV